MVLILSPAQLIALFPKHDVGPFKDKEDLVQHLLFVFNQKEKHQFILKSCDNQSFCAMVYRKNTQNLLNTHFDTHCDDNKPQVNSWTESLNVYFKQLHFEPAPFFSI